jgi:serine/threonine protein phosphatase PrpC
MMPPPDGKKNNGYWPTISLFAIFDGHGGYRCAEFLKENLHKIVKF